MKEENIINIRKLASLDIALHGKLPIIIEFFLGVFLIASIGLYLLYLGQAILGVYMMFLALNYVPLLMYAISIARYGNKRKVDINSNIRKYNLQQFMIFIPLSIVVLSILQEFKS